VPEGAACPGLPDGTRSGGVEDVEREEPRFLLARRIAGKSIALLSNDGALPLKGGDGSIAVIGPNAHEGRNLYGDYTYPAHIESLTR
jgi:beta-glucosidase